MTTCITLYVLLHLVPPAQLGEEAHLRVLLWQARNENVALWYDVQRADREATIAIAVSLLTALGAAAALALEAQ